MLFNRAWLASITSLSPTVLIMVWLEVLPSSASYAQSRHVQPHRVFDITLINSWRWCQSAVGCEDTVVDEPSCGVELGVEGLDAPAKAVFVVRDGLKDSCADDRL